MIDNLKKYCKLSNISVHIFAVLFFYLSLSVVQLERFAGDPGLGWHLKTGEFISKHFKIPTSDIFLFPKIINEWICDQWLADLILYKILEFGDWAFLYNILLITFFITFSVVIYRYLYKFTGLYLFSTLATLFAFKSGQVHFICRPVLIGFLFFAVIFYELLLNSKKNSFISKREYLLFFIVFCLWANIHPSFVLGLVLIGFAALAKILDYYHLKDIKLEEFKKIFLSYVALGAVSFFATLLNPAFLKLHYSVIWLSRSEFAMKSYSEWQPPDISGLTALFLIVPVAFLMLNTILKRLELYRYNFFIIISFLFFFYYSINIVRFIPYYGIVAAPLIVLLLKDICIFIGARKNQVSTILNEAGINIEKREAKASRGFFIAILLVVLSISYELSNNKVFLFSGSYGPLENYYPKIALDKILNESDKSQINILNSQNYGGYITYFGNGRAKAYIDDRTSLLKDEYYHEFNDNFKVGKIMPFARKVKADYIIIQMEGMNKELVNYVKKEYQHLILHIDDHCIALSVLKA